MSFYGDIKRVQSSPYVFDKYYPNRASMEAACTTDNVYIGRYVLVKYTFKDPQQTDNDVQTYFDKYEMAPIPASQGNNEDNNTLEKKVFKGYQFNANKDINIYNDTFDGTVWQKIYTNTAGGDQLEKYILVAELNAAVPRMDLRVISPKYTDGTIDSFGEQNENWNNPDIAVEASTEDAYMFLMPNVLHLDVGNMGENFYAKQLIDPVYRWRMTSDVDSNGVAKSTNPDTTKGGGGQVENAISHSDMLSSDYNYMTWKNYRIENDEMVPAEGAGNIDGKKLETKLYAFGQLISDLYDALYGVPMTDDGLRPFYTDKLDDVIGNYDKGLVGVLTSIATDMKGDSSQDLYGRNIQPGMYYYFTSAWNSAEENPNSFIENIPKVIGSDNELKQNKSHYRINYWDNTSGSYITNVASSGQN